MAHNFGVRVFSMGGMLRIALAAGLGLTMLIFPKVAASADSLQSGTVSGGSSGGVTVTVDWAETEYDTIIDFTVHVSVAPHAGGYDSPYFFRAIAAGVDGRAQVGATGGDMTLTGRRSGPVLEADASTWVRVIAINGYGYDQHVIYDETLDFDYVDTPSRLGIEVDEWEATSDGIRWGVTIDWDSLAGTVDEVCSDWYRSCRAWLYAEDSSGHEHIMKPYQDGYTVSYFWLPRFGRDERYMTNVGGQPLAPDDYTSVFIRVSVIAANGLPVNLESPHVPVGVPDDFVYVALGDSYQSGEGVGNSITNTNLYLTAAYENGSNFPERVGAEQDTYSPQLLTGGNGCHRALANYAKINRDLLEPDANVTLVDVTCSGAEIESSGGKPPVVGSVGEGVSNVSQVNQAMLRLREAGLDPADVDLVTVGMGGNDAGFGKIIQQCVIPSLVERLLALYPDRPAEVQFINDTLVSCQNIDIGFGKGEIDAKIDALQAKEEWAQEQLLLSFPNARIQQVDYPNILPVGKTAPTWCGGIRKEDLDFARSRVVRINNAIRASVAATASPRYQLVDLETAFGASALCPSSAEQSLANGLNEANVLLETVRLLNLNGDGDATARALLDALVDRYNDFKACSANDLNPFDSADCGSKEAWAAVKDAYNALKDYFMEPGRLDTIIANIVQPPGPLAEPDNVRFDRSRGSFHPNGAGQAVIACTMRAAYAGDSTTGCFVASDPAPDTVDGLEVWLGPIIAYIRQLLTLNIGGFAPGSTIDVTFHSSDVDLGDVTADADGRAVLTVQVPDVAAGIHRLQLSGVGAGGVQVVKEVKVEIPGDPTPGGDYGVYLTGFDGGDPGQGVLEYVDVTYMGIEFTVLPDEAGGVFLELPVPNNSGVVTVSAVSQLTGKTVGQNLVIDNPNDLTLGAWGSGVELAPDWNAVNAGRSVPLTFRVLDGQGEPVNDPAVIALRTHEIDCATGDDLGPVAPAADAGNSGLRYQGSGWWKFNWKTDKVFSGTCRTFSVVIDNGGRHDLWFDFR